MTSEDNVEQALILLNPYVTIGIGDGATIDGDGGQRARTCTINESHKMIIVEQGVELKLPPNVIGGSKFERSLGCDIEGYKVDRRGLHGSQSWVRSTKRVW